MIHLVFIAMFLFGSVIGWLVVYFVRKYKEYTPKVLRDTALLFLGSISEDEFKNLIKNTGLSLDAFQKLTGGYLGDMYISPDLAAYIQAKNLLGSE